MSATIRTKPEPSCPECGAIMRLRRPPPGKSWEPFWGCNRFPNCKGTMNIDTETGKPVGKYDDLSYGDGLGGGEDE